MLFFFNEGAYDRSGGCRQFSKLLLKVVEFMTKLAEQQCFVNPQLNGNEENFWSGEKIIEILKLFDINEHNYFEYKVQPSFSLLFFTLD